MNTKPGKVIYHQARVAGLRLTDSATENDHLGVTARERVKTGGKSTRYMAVMACRGKPLREQDKIGMCR